MARGGTALGRKRSSFRFGRRTALVLINLALSAAANAPAIGAAPPPPLVRPTAPAPAAQGWQASYTDASGLPARWDPCRPIRYVVSTAQLPASGRRDLAEALRRLSAASGITFEDGGTVTERPSLARAPFQPQRYGHRWVPLLVAWVQPGETDMRIGANVPGTSMAVAVANPGGGSIVSGQVVLHAGDRLTPGFGPGLTQGKVLLHELAHALGLGHVDDADQLMHPMATPGPPVLGAGDLAGLAALGAASGCHQAPPPRHIDPVRALDAGRA